MVNEEELIKNKLKLIKNKIEKLEKIWQTTGIKQLNIVWDSNPCFII